MVSAGSMDGIKICVAPTESGHVTANEPLYSPAKIPSKENVALKLPTSPNQPVSQSKRDSPL